MKYFILILCLAGLYTNNAVAQNSATQAKEFERIAQNFQVKYNAGKDNCEFILNSIDKNIQMSEIAFSAPLKIFTYEQLEQFCPHLPKKEIIETTSEQRLFGSNIGYDYVTQLYLRKSAGDTLRETSSKIWENKNGVWKIIHMNNSINKVCN